MNNYINKCCGTCKWWSQAEGLCEYNQYSTSENDSCDNWEPIED